MKTLCCMNNLLCCWQTINAVINDASEGLKNIPESSHVSWTLETRSETILALVPPGRLVTVKATRCDSPLAK